MSWLTDFFRPRQDNFIRLLVEHAACVVKGLEALNTYAMATPVKPEDEEDRNSRPVEVKANEGRVTGKNEAKAEIKPDIKSTDWTGAVRGSTRNTVEAVRRCEEEADEVRRILLSELNRTFVTPIDREDISALSRAIDDIMDYAWSTVQEMEMFHVSPTSHLKRMVSLLLDAANEVYLAMLRLKDHPAVAAEHAQRAKALENRVETVYREALADLFDGPAGPKRIINILKMREVYRHLSNAADRGDAAANIISDIVVKMT